MSANGHSSLPVELVDPEADTDQHPHGDDVETNPEPPESLTVAASWVPVWLARASGSTASLDRAIAALAETEALKAAANEKFVAPAKSTEAKSA